MGDPFDRRDASLRNNRHDPFFPLSLAEARGFSIRKQFAFRNSTDILLAHHDPFRKGF